MYALIASTPLEIGQPQQQTLSMLGIAIPSSCEQTYQIPSDTIGTASYTCNYKIMSYQTTSPTADTWFGLSVPILWAGSSSSITAPSTLQSNSGSVIGLNGLNGQMPTWSDPSIVCNLVGSGEVQPGEITDVAYSCYATWKPAEMASSGLSNIQQAGAIFFGAICNVGAVCYVGNLLSILTDVEGLVGDNVVLGVNFSIPFGSYSATVDVPVVASQTALTAFGLYLGVELGEGLLDVSLLIGTIAACGLSFGLGCAPAFAISAAVGLTQAAVADSYLYQLANSQ